MLYISIITLFCGSVYANENFAMAKYQTTGTTCCYHTYNDRQCQWWFLSVSCGITLTFSIIGFLCINIVITMWKREGENHFPSPSSSSYIFLSLTLFFQSTKHSKTQDFFMQFWYRTNITLIDKFQIVTCLGLVL